MRHSGLWIWGASPTATAWIKSMPFPPCLLYLTVQCCGWTGLGVHLDPCFSIQMLKPLQPVVFLSHLAFQGSHASPAPGPLLWTFVCRSTVRTEVWFLVWLLFWFLSFCWFLFNPGAMGTLNLLLHPFWKSPLFIRFTAMATILFPISKNGTILLRTT